MKYLVKAIQYPALHIFIDNYICAKTY